MRAIRIRPARQDDVPALGRLAAALVRFHVELDAARFMNIENAEVGYGRWLGKEAEDPEALVLVAEGPTGEVVGYAYARLEPKNYNALLVKTRAGLLEALAWLDANLSEALDALPRDRDVALLEVTLFCLVEHLEFRPTLPIDGYANLRRFAAEFAARPSARRTAYRYDAKPPRP